MASTTPPDPPGDSTPSPAGATRLGRRQRLLFAALGTATILAGWQLLSSVVSPAILASPVDTAQALGTLARSGTLWTQLLITLRRLAIGLGIGVGAGLVTGVLAGLHPRLRSFLEPVRWVGMTTPAVIIAVLAMLWFGLGDRSVIFIVAVIVGPVMFVNTVAGVLAVDSRLVEMAGVYRFPRRLLLSEVYVPGIGSEVIAGLTLATGIAIRAVVLGEVLGAMDGIGYSFSRAMSYLDTPELFAWVVVLLGLMGALDFGVLRPLERRVMRWRRGDGA